jgi:hypothetical protein
VFAVSAMKVVSYSNALRPALGDDRRRRDRGEAGDGARMLARETPVPFDVRGIERLCRPIGPSGHHGQRRLLDGVEAAIAERDAVDREVTAPPPPAATSVKGSMSGESSGS